MRLGGPGEVDGADDLAQCIRVALTTPLGSEPLRPWFGSDLWRYVDQPVTAAQPYIVQEVRRAADLCEPRAETTRVRVEVGADGAGLLVAVGFGRRGEEGEVGTVIVEVAG